MLGFRSVVVGTALLAVVVLNQGCIEEETRMLKRRVQMGQMRSPAIALPNAQGNFDFQFVVNAQAYDVLRRANAFSTATFEAGKTFDVTGLQELDAKSFNQCPDGADNLRASAVGLGMISETAACMIDQPQGVLSGDLVNFQLTSSGGSTLSMLDVPLLPHATFEFKRYELSANLKIMDPLIPGRVIASSSDESYSNDIGTTATIDFVGLKAGPKFYYSSPLRKVVDEVLASAMRDLRNQWDKASPWYTTVVRQCDKTLFINGGNKTDAGLMVGDIVRINNVLYRWSGLVCQSALMGSTVVERPMGWARITSVGDTMSVAQLIEDDSNYPLAANRSIKPGSRIYMEKFVPTR